MKKQYVDVRKMKSMRRARHACIVDSNIAIKRLKREYQRQVSKGLTTQTYIEFCEALFNYIGERIADRQEFDEVVGELYFK